MCVCAEGWGAEGVGIRREEGRRDRGYMCEVGTVMFINKLHVIHHVHYIYKLYMYMYMLPLKGQRMTSCACKHLCWPLREFYHISPSLVQLARSYASWTSAPWPPSLPPRSPPIIPPNLARAVIQHHTIALHQHILHARKRSNQT